MNNSTNTCHLIFSKFHKACENPLVVTTDQKLIFNDDKIYLVGKQVSKTPFLLDRFLDTPFVSNCLIVTGQSLLVTFYLLPVTPYLQIFVRCS